MSDQARLGEQTREQMGDWVMDYVRRRKRRKHRLTVAGVAAVTLAGVVGASAWVVLAPREVVDHKVWCFEQPRTDARFTGAESPFNEPVDDAAANALSVCEDLWRLGVLDQKHGSAGGGADGRVHLVPQLALCSRPDGTLAVFPAGPAGTPPLTRAEDEVFCNGVGLLPDPSH